ncbi:F-box domain containing protein [Tanacetum coccineum]
MSDNIPFDIQLAIMNRLPVKSLLQFRTVSKLWKYSIDCSDFVREYGFRESNNCSLYLTFKQNFEGVICSVDDNLALSPVVSNLNFFNLTPFATSEGVWCFSYGENSMLLIWNPSLKKSVRILVPNYLLEADSPKMLFGFGVHPVTLDPTLLKINYPYYGQGPWYVSVFTLSSRTWYKLDSYCLPRESIRIKRAGQAVVGGKIFWVGSEKFYSDDGISYKIYMLVSFDLITHQFQVIDMPEEMLVGQCLPPYYISQLGDCIIISGSFKFVDFSIIYAWELQVDDGEVSWYRKLFTLRYPIEHDLKLIGFTKDKQPIVEASFVQQLHQSLQLAPHVEPSSYNYKPDRIIPGPAGLVQRAKLLKENVFILDPDGALMSNKSIMRNVLERYLNVTLKDLSGTVPGTINYKVLDVGSYGKDITVGAAMILANVLVFTLKPSKHYLNITKKSVLGFRKSKFLEVAVLLEVE